ncbi:MAG: M48 family peptidase [Thiothrix sp.]|nr:MAG: M48 family peptidase [Thiothrix sp.]
MTTHSTLSISNIPIQVIRKPIKNLHLAVYPPNGQVRISAPLRITDDSIRLLVINRLQWIKKQQAKFTEQPRQTEREWVSGESHYLWGQRYRLDVTYQDGKPSLQFKGDYLYITLPQNTSATAREHLITQYYRQALKQRIPELLAKWQPKLEVAVNAWGIRRMKTKWGSCNINDKRIWLNLELAKKSPECLEFVVVHELVHLLERHHNQRFYALMDQYLATWRIAKDKLNKEHLAHESWQQKLK